jgi:septal ring factor EnvC (AmiA/AmiB activator)
VGLFGNGHGKRLADLEAEIATLRARVVKAEATASEAAERAYRYMKKAEARARREADSEESGTASAADAVTPSLPPASGRPWGARGRRLMAARLGRVDPLANGSE